MSKIHLIARFQIQKGKLEVFRQTAQECMEIVREKESDSLLYEWFLDPDQEECVVLETYRDSDAVLQHIQNVGEPLGRLAAMSEVSIELFGDPSEELIEASRGFAPGLYRPFDR